MYIKLESDTIIESKEIIGIFDLDKTTVFKVNRNYLLNVEKRGKIISTTNDLPKSFVVCFEKGDSYERVYLSAPLSYTLVKRSTVSNLG